MRIGVIGANGQLGVELMKALSEWAPVGLVRHDLDVCDLLKTRQVFSAVKPDLVINTAAFNHVDGCEDEPGTAFAVNAHGACNLAQVCADLGCALMHISTDYVFGGEKRSLYSEEDVPNPLSVYAVSKLAGEYFVRNICPRHYVIRTSGLYGVARSSGKGGNFVETMIRMAKANRAIRVVNDQVLTPSYTRDLAFKIRELIPTREYGLYHMTNSGQCSWYEFAREIFARLGLKPVLEPTTIEAYGSKAARAQYSALANNRLKHIGMPNYRRGIRLFAHSW